MPFSYIARNWMLTKPFDDNGKEVIDITFWNPSELKYVKLGFPCPIRHPTYDNFFHKYCLRLVNYVLYADEKAIQFMTNKGEVVFVEFKHMKNNEIFEKLHHKNESDVMDILDSWNIDSDIIEFSSPLKTKCKGGRILDGHTCSFIKKHGKIFKYTCSSEKKKNIETYGYSNLVYYE
jgi:hypothetical protein